MTEALLDVENLQKYYYEQDTIVDRLLGRDPQAVQAVDGVSFEVREGETLGLVGESGCGKSTTGETILNLREPTGGTVRFDGEPIFEAGGDDMTAFRKRAGMVFQDPFSSLDPRMTAAQIVREPLEVHDVGDDQQRRDRVDELLERVGLSADQRDRYPHEFSGGQQQRLGIARAIALEPDLLVLDEPVSALDVSVQAQILNLLSDLQEDLGLTYLFIAHDLSVIRYISDRVAVMYLGEIVEKGPVDDIFESPKHPYTEALLESVPRAETEEYYREVEILEGDVPSPRDPPSGCRFRTRCPEIIPPDDVEIEQSAYRGVTDIRDRLADGELPLDRARERAAERSGGDHGIGAVVDLLREEFVDGDLGGENRETVDEALRLALDDEPEEARQRLRDRFESVCERETPVLQDEGHPAACHLYEQPERDERAEEATAD